MSKLEQKLVELGYETSNEIYKYWSKGNITIITFLGKIVSYYLSLEDVKIFKSQQDIDNLQQAFNILQQDLEVLKSVEDIR